MHRLPAPSRRLLAPALALSLALTGVAACSDDDDDGTTTAGTAAEDGAGPSTSASSGVEGDPAAFCDAYVQLSSAMAAGGESGDMEQLAADLQANAPEEIAGDVETLLGIMQEMAGGPSGESSGEDVAGVQAQQGEEASTTTAAPGAADEPTRGEAEGEGEGQQGPPPPEFLESSAVVGAWAAEECAEASIDVTATDYAFDGIPADVPAGDTGIAFRNDGTEWHEIIVMRKLPGTTESAMQLLEMPEEEAMAKVEQVASAFAAPGGESGTVASLTAGDYIAVCFIPQGTTSLESEATGPPHFTAGMVTEFSVS